MQAVLRIDVAADLFAEVLTYVPQQRPEFLCHAAPAARHLAVEFVNRQRPGDFSRKDRLLSQTTDLVQFQPFGNLLNTHRQVVAVVIQHRCHGVDQISRHFTAQRVHHGSAVSRGLELA